MPNNIVGIVGYHPCEDGALNAVYLDAAGRQFIVDLKGRRVYGVWFEREKDQPPEQSDEETQIEARSEATVEQPAARP
jgi:hypothetical protein